MCVPVISLVWKSSPFKMLTGLMQHCSVPSSSLEAELPCFSLSTRLLQETFRLFTAANCAASLGSMPEDFAVDRPANKGCSNRKEPSGLLSTVHCPYCLTNAIWAGHLCCLHIVDQAVLMKCC